MRSALLALLLVGCASITPQHTTVAYVHVESFNWYASDVVLYCRNGRRLGAIHDLVLNARHKKKIKIGACREMVFVVQGLSVYPYNYPYPTPLYDGVTICITVAPTLRHTHAEICSRAT